ncbi:hypothetical protein [Novosphingobium sp. P6W]|uniref:hypothetical protein n=1 Tax=Novosphingobium sp. P6W TaxID=1609758 RepID=UPI000ADD7F51|nr:hypothetical protein [Novosphingobium sp. P6W]
MEALEEAALRFEGALFALHDIMAHSLARQPEAMVDRIFDDAKAHADSLDESLGRYRIEGYRSELSSIKDEIDFARRKPQGVWSRLRRD